MTQLRRQMLEELERRNYSANTIRSYVRAVEEYARYFKRSPEKLGLDEIRSYQAHLIGKRKLAANTVAQRLAALRFLYVKTLRRGWDLELTPYPKRPTRLPKVSPLRLGLSALRRPPADRRALDCGSVARSLSARSRLAALS